MKPGGLWLGMEPANLLKIDTLSEDWRDADSLLLHAGFQILVDFVEKEKAFNCHVDWDNDQKHILAKAEILELYNWWKSHEETETLDEKYIQENEMLKRLVDIRWALWT